MNPLFTHQASVAHQESLRHRTAAARQVPRTGERERRPARRAAISPLRALLGR